MANPRQRRKTRSSSHKPVKQSRRTNKLLKKQPPIKGPKVLQDAWDSHKTVRQNYAALGLAHSLTPTDSGGRDTTHVRVQKARTGDDATAESGDNDNDKGEEKREGKLARGYGRIIRDASGAVVDVVLAEEEASEGGKAAEGQGLEENENERGRRTLGGRAGGRVKGSRDEDWLLEKEERDGTQEEVVGALEEESRGGVKRLRTSSKAEVGYLRGLVEEYGGDYEAMARDRRRNVQQYSAGQLGRAIAKAGLVLT